MAKSTISFKINSRNVGRIAALVDVLKGDIESVSSDAALEAIRMTALCFKDMDIEDLISDNGLKHIDQTIGTLQKIKAKAIEARAIDEDSAKIEV